MNNCVDLEFIYYIPEKDLENLPDIVETYILEIISEQSKIVYVK